MGIVTSRIAIGIFASALAFGLAQCSPAFDKDAVKADIKAEVRSQVAVAFNAHMQSSGPQDAKSGTWTVQIGAIEIGGASAVMLALILVAAFLWRGKDSFKKIADVLIKDNLSRNITEKEKEDIQKSALSLGVEHILNSRVKLLKKKNNGKSDGPTS